MPLKPEQEFFLTQWRSTSKLDQEDWALRMYSDNLRMVEFMSAQTLQLQELQSQIGHYEALSQQSRSARLPKEDFNI